MTILPFLGNLHGILARLFLLACAFFAVSISPCQAGSKIWKNPYTGGWSTGDFWVDDLPPGDGDTIENPAQFGQLQIDTSPTVENWNFSAGTTWIATAWGTADARTLTITGTLSRGGGNGVMDFRSTLNNSGTLSMNIVAVKVTGGELRLGDNSTNTALQGLTVTGTTLLSGGQIKVNVVSGTFGVINNTGGNFRIFETGTTVSASGGISAAGLIGNAGTIATHSTGNMPTAVAVTGTLTLNGTGSYAYSGLIKDTTGSGSAAKLGLLKTASGTQILSGSNAYSGGTTVTGGMLLINNAGNSSGVGAGPVIVGYQGVFGGTGRASLAGNVLTGTASGSLLAGDGVNPSGTLTIDNAELSMSSDSMLRIVLGASGSHSTLARTGAADWSFSSSQFVRFIVAGSVDPGTYTNIITGLSPSTDVSKWRIANAGWTGTFSSNSGNVSFVLSATAPTMRAFGGPGFGSDTPAGFGSSTSAAVYSGSIYRVTTLSGTGSGSLLAGIKATGPRIIVFDVSGTIDLGAIVNETDKGTGVEINHPYITIAGQTAPPPGITLIRGYMKIVTHDVLVQHIRVRPGDGAYNTSGSDGKFPDKSFQRDALSIGGSDDSDDAHDVVIDHCSFSWGTDETVSIASAPMSDDGGQTYKGYYPPPYNITLSNNIIAEGLHKSSVQDKQGGHSRGSSFGNLCKNLASIRNVYAHFDRRLPLIAFDTTGVLVNNLICDPGTRAIELWGICKDKRMPEATRWAFVNNQVLTETSLDITGKETWSWLPPYAFRAIIHNGLETSGTTHDSSTAPYPAPELYIKNDQYRLRASGSYSSQQVVSGTTLTVRASALAGTDEFSVKNTSNPIIELDEPPVWPEGIVLLSLQGTYNELIAHAGARPAERMSGIFPPPATEPYADPVDSRIIYEIKSGTEYYAGTTPYGRGIINSQQEVGGYPIVISSTIPTTDFTSGMTTKAIKEKLDEYSRAVEVGGKFPR